MTIGDRVKEWRTTRRVTQKDLAEALGITQSALSLYERNARRIDADTLSQIALLLEVPITYFFGYSKFDDITSAYGLLSDSERTQVDNLILKLASNKLVKA